MAYVISTRQISMSATLPYKLPSSRQHLVPINILYKFLLSWKFPFSGPDFTGLVTRRNVTVICDVRHLKKPNMSAVVLTSGTHLLLAGPSPPEGAAPSNAKFINAWSGTSTSSSVSILLYLIVSVGFRLQEVAVGRCKPGCATVQWFDTWLGARYSANSSKFIKTVNDLFVTRCCSCSCKTLTYSDGKDVR